MAKILLVEDDTNLSEIYQARMEAEGYGVVAASDGEAALALAAKEKPDLIISDVMMPKISGFEMLDILRNTDGLKNTPIIMLTALGQADDKSRADQLGADRYLVKSQVTLEDIVNAAHSILEGNSTTAVQQPADVATPMPVPMPIASVPVVVDPATIIPADPAPTGSLGQTTPAPVGDATTAVADDTVAIAPAADDNTVTADGTTDTTLMTSMPVFVEPPVDQPQIVEPAAVEAAYAQQPEPEVVQDIEVSADLNTQPQPPAPELIIPAVPPTGDSSPNFTQGGSPASVTAPVVQPEATVAAEATADPIVSDAPATPTPPADRRHVASYTSRPVQPVHIPLTMPPAAQTSQPDAVPDTEAAAPVSSGVALDEQVVSRAIDELLSKVPAANVPAVEQPPVTPMPVVSPPPADDAMAHGSILPSPSDTTTTIQNQTALRNRSIEPIPREPGPSLDELLAREAGKPDAAGLPPGAAVVPTPTEDPPPVVLPEIAALEAAAEDDARQKPTDQSKPPFDPNSIAL